MRVLLFMFAFLAIESLAYRSLKLEKTQVSKNKQATQNSISSIIALDQKSVNPFGTATKI